MDNIYTSRSAGVALILAWRQDHIVLLLWGHSWVGSEASFCDAGIIWKKKNPLRCCESLRNMLYFFFFFKAKDNVTWSHAALKRWLGQGRPERKQTFFVRLCDGCTSFWKLFQLVYLQTAPTSVVNLLSSCGWKLPATVHSANWAGAKWISRWLKAV